MILVRSRTTMTARALSTGVDSRGGGRSSAAADDEAHGPEAAYAGLLALQSGVVSRRQLITTPVSSRTTSSDSCAARPCPVHDGVFVNHTGAPTWLQRAWVGVLPRLAGRPAATTAHSALPTDRAERPRRSVIHLAVDRDRHRCGAHRLPLAPHELGSTTGAVEHQPTSGAHRGGADRRGGPQAGRLRRDRRACRCDPARRPRTAGRIREHLTLAARPPPRLPPDVLARPGPWHVLGARARLPHPGRAGRTVSRTACGRCATRATVRSTATSSTTHFEQVVELDGRMWHDSVERHDADLDRDLDAAVGPPGDRPAGVGPGLRRGRARPPYASGACSPRAAGRARLTRCPDCPTATLAG